ncbi:MAG: Crp/Fnr family transcriptional regulator [Rubrivivax sp.]|nr:MAG: Crp/Fnr family transcriptional regulator [Rubrivivax sp.]
MGTYLHAADKVLSRDVWFANLPEDMKTAVLSMAIIQNVKAGQRIFSRGDSTSGVYGLIEGAIMVMNEVEPGQDGALVHLAPPTWFGEVGLFDGLCRTHNVETVQDSTLLLLPLGPLSRLLDEHPAYWKHFALLLTQKLRLAFMALDELAKVPVETRLARRLVMMSIGLTPDRIRDVIEVHQEQLAQMMGISRTAVNAILRDLRKKGILSLAYGRIRILDMDRLKVIAGFEHWLPTVPFRPPVQS